MMTGALLVAWCIVLATGLPWLLQDARWPTRAPRLALALWQAASASFIVSAILGGVALADPDSVSPQAFTHPFMSCAGAVWSALRTPEGAAVVGGGLLLSSVVATRTIWFLGTGMASAAKRRRHHGLRLALVARHDTTIGAMVVDHPVPQAYCLPGRHATIVVTSAAVRQLPPAELEAVLAHERAHVRARHHIVVGAASGLGRAFGFIPLFRSASNAAPALIEMAADDSAARTTDRQCVASALMALAHVPVPAAALGAAGHSAVVRVRRLLMHAPAGVPIQVMAALAITAVLAMPFAAIAIASVAPHGIAACCATLTGLAQ